MTPLSRSAQNGYLEVVEFLVKEASANLGSKNMREETALTPRDGHEASECYVPLTRERASEGP